jgi:hypothetical protein
MVSRYSTIRFLPNKSTLTLFIFKFVPWLPYMNIIISICYFFYTLFIICFYLDGDLSNILIDFNSNYSAAFDLYTDNTVYSSGGNNGNFFFDPIRNTFIEPENPQNPPTNDTLPATRRTDTTKLADFLETKAGQPIRRTGIRFSEINRLTEELKYYSKVTIGVRREYPTMFSSDAGCTRLNRGLLNFIKSLDKDYDLNSIYV